jgi:hypothetical protein
VTIKWDDGAGGPPGINTAVFKHYVIFMDDGVGGPLVEVKTISNRMSLTTTLPTVAGRKYKFGHLV